MDIGSPACFDVPELFIIFLIFSGKIVPWNSGVLIYPLSRPLNIMQVAPMAIDVLFPRPVFQTVDETDVCKRSRLREACLAIADKPEVKDRSKNNFHRVSTSHLVDDHLHESGAFAPLVDYVDKCSKVFLKSLGFPDSRITIDQMWTNVGEKGDFVYPHTHIGEAFMAGVYYVSCDPRDGITFHSDTDRTPPAEYNPLNYTTYYYDGQVGRLLLFRAETEHSTFPQEGDERIIVSFNLKLAEQG